jgi:hypothetical protein
MLVIVASVSRKLKGSTGFSRFTLQRVILREWLTEFTESEGSDNEMRNSSEQRNQSEEDGRWKRSRTVKSEVYVL